MSSDEELPLPSFTSTPLLIPPPIAWPRPPLEPFYTILWGTAPVLVGIIVVLLGVAYVLARHDRALLQLESRMKM